MNQEPYRKVIDASSPIVDYGKKQEGSGIMSSSKGKRKAAISEHPTDLEFRKPNESIGLRVKEGRLTLLSRKLYNVLVFHAQRLRTTGQNAPIETEAAKKYFWIPFADVARKSDYDSNDMEFLKQHVEELQNVKVHLEDDRQYTSERLISSVKLVNPAGLKKRGGMMWLGFAFPPEVFEVVMSPDSYTKLSIYYQGILRSGHAIALYEICRRYATNPSKLTRPESYAYWHEVLSGAPAADVPPPYKYYKRDVLKPIITEISALTDIEIELIERKQGRKVVGLQFRVELKRQPGLEFSPPPVLDGDLIAAIMEYGIGQSDAADMTVKFTEEKLRNAIQVVKDRKAAKNLPPLESDAAYFRWALRQGTTPQKKAVLTSLSVKEPVKAELRPVMERFLAARAREAFGMFSQLNPDEQTSLLGEFRESSYSKGVRLTKALSTLIQQTAVGEWYAEHLWGEPTAEALASFLEMPERK